MKDNFTVRVYFQNGLVLEKEVPLSKAVKLSSKENVIVENDVDCVEIKGVNGTIIVPIIMTFVIQAAPPLKHLDRVSRYMLYKRDNGKCGYCGTALSQRESTIDHIHPKAQGGRTVWENVVIACKKCNCEKDNKTPEQAGMKLRVKPYNPKRKKVLTN